MTTSADEPLNGDLSVRVTVDSTAMPWTPSPSPAVKRKRLHRVGPAESGQVTSIVRYEPGSHFPAHDHPQGEEILVLEGVFSDEHGDWPAGTYLLNPEGFRHAPFSRQGCVLFVKLRQFPGAARRHVAVNTQTLPWQAGGAPGVSVKPLYSQPGFTDTDRLEQWAPGTAVEMHYPQGAEMLILEGELTDEDGTWRTGTWLRVPPGSRQRGSAPRGCTLYIKEGGFAYLASA
ncbi:MAG TPA: cupin domain-containing protein [Steroidobacteraceae bacterium]|nr:cupin domain-containing protein [Steroidobacteraceae bacterium]